MLASGVENSLTVHRHTLTSFVLPSRSSGVRGREGGHDNRTLSHQSGVIELVKECSGGVICAEAAVGSRADVLHAQDSGLGSNALQYAHHHIIRLS